MRCIQTILFWVGFNQRRTVTTMIYIEYKYIELVLINTKVIWYNHYIYIYIVKQNRLIIYIITGVKLRLNINTAQREGNILYLYINSCKIYGEWRSVKAESHIFPNKAKTYRELLVNMNYHLNVPLIAHVHHLPPARMVDLTVYGWELQPHAKNKWQFNVNPVLCLHFNLLWKKYTALRAPAIPDSFQ